MIQLLRIRPAYGSNWAALTCLTPWSEERSPPYKDDRVKWFRIWKILSPVQFTILAPKWEPKFKSLRLTAYLSRKEYLKRHFKTAFIVFPCLTPRPHSFGDIRNGKTDDIMHRGVVRRSVLGAYASWIIVMGARHPS